MPPYLILTYEDNPSAAKPVVRIEQGEGRYLPPTGPFAQQNPIDVWIQQTPRLQIVMSFNDSRGFDITLTRSSPQRSAAPVQPLLPVQSKQNIQNLHELPEIVCGQSASSPVPLLLETKTMLMPPAYSAVQEEDTGAKRGGAARPRRDFVGKGRVRCPHCPRRFRTRGAQTLHLRSHREAKQAPDSP